MAFPSPRSLPQQPHGGGGSPDRGSNEERIIRMASQLRNEQMREGAGMPPTPRKEGGPFSQDLSGLYYGDPGDLDPMENLFLSRRRQELKFPEVFGWKPEPDPVKLQKQEWLEPMMKNSDIQGPDQMLIPGQQPRYHPYQGPHRLPGELFGQ